MSLNQIIDLYMTENDMRARDYVACTSARPTPFLDAEQLAEDLHDCCYLLNREVDDDELYAACWHWLNDHYDGPTDEQVGFSKGYAEQ